MHDSRCHNYNINLIDHTLMHYIQQLSPYLSLFSKYFYFSENSKNFKLNNQIFIFGNNDFLNLVRLHVLLEMKKFQSNNYEHTRQGKASTQETALELTGPRWSGPTTRNFSRTCELVACIIYEEDGSQSGPITDPIRSAQVEHQLGHVVDAHAGRGERRCVSLTASASAGAHSSPPVDVRRWRLQELSGLPRW